jgi:hypothetical protein
VSLLHGDFAAAWAFHPLAVPFWLAAVAYLLVYAATGRRPNPSARIILLAAVVTVATWVWRLPMLLGPASPV